jgi:glycosyltransferase involved in cell wall biosynthesis
MYGDRVSYLKSDEIVTIILINKNHGHTLSQTIESYLRQSALGVKILCIDGNSTDNSLQIVKKYKEVEVISKIDRSGSEAIVRGLKLAKGKYIMIATSNDMLIDDNFIKDSLEIMEEDNSISCVFGKVLSMTSDGTVGNEIFPYTSDYFGDYKKNFLRWLNNGASFHECASLFRRDVVLNCLPNLEDFIFEIEQLKEDLTLRLRYEFYSRGFKATFINKDVIAVRDHLDRTSVKFKDHIYMHLMFYDRQIFDFRKKFLSRRDYRFRSLSNSDLERLGKLEIFKSYVIILYLLTRRILGQVKKLTLNRLRRRGDERI